MSNVLTVVEQASLPAADKGGEPVVEPRDSMGDCKLNKPQSITTLLTATNAAELICAVSEKVLGDDVATSFAGAELNKQMISQLAQSVFEREISQSMGK